MPDLLTCQACGDEVVFDPLAPGIRCGYPHCETCSQPGYSGRFVHVGTDCGKFLWAVRQGG